MFYDYAYAIADQVADLRRELFIESVEVVSGSDTDYMSVRLKGANRKPFPQMALVRATPNDQEGNLKDNVIKQLKFALSPQIKSNLSIVVTDYISIAAPPGMMNLKYFKNQPILY